MNQTPTPPSPHPLPHSSHWGAFSVVIRDSGVEIVPHPRDPRPSPLLGNIPASVSHHARIARPMVRRGWLERGPGADRGRGRDGFVPVEWQRAIDLVAAELQRVYTAHGPVAVFGGSWTFIISFGVFLVIWVIINVVVLATRAFDPYPFILLNLFLSMLAALQAPVIMMSQNRQASKDRLKADLDYEVNLKAELEVAQLHRKIDHLTERLEGYMGRAAKRV